MVDHAAWREAYQRELATWAERLPQRRVTSVFFGGGTPSLMEPQTAETVLQSIQRHWPLADDVEITLEANPTSVEAGNFAEFRAAGVNRLSLGVQSLRDDALKFLGRAHDAAQAKAAIGCGCSACGPRVRQDSPEGTTTESLHARVICER